MLKTSFFALAAAASFATSAFAQGGPTCPSGEALRVTETQCTEFGGALSATGGCALTPASLARAEQAVCASNATQAQASQGISGAAAGAAIGLGLAVVLIAGDDDTTTTTTTTTTN